MVRHGFAGLPHDVESVPCDDTQTACAPGPDAPAGLATNTPSAIIAGAAAAMATLPMRRSFIRALPRELGHRNSSSPAQRRQRDPPAATHTVGLRYHAVGTDATGAGPVGGRVREG